MILTQMLTDIDNAATRPIVLLSMDWLWSEDLPFIPVVMQMLTALRGVGAAENVVSSTVYCQGFCVEQMPGALPDG